ncbi:MAG: ferritin-like domain-containing protein [Cyclobacteriaceae bacterium]|nr:ferritin-like domain-containing protein [Cyclobacteriaceae bacterium]
MKNMKTVAVDAKTKAHPGAQLEEFFYEALKDIYWAEKQLTKAIPKMIRAATTEELQEVLDEHLEETIDQVTQLEKVFELLDKKPLAKKCDAMEGLMKEAESIIEETEEGSMTRDVALIFAGQKIEHYEIATYGTLVRLAKTMNREDVADLLNKILDQEKEADMTLTGVAENNINVEATQEVEA